MKGLILSGGAGTRLRPITHTSAKQLVPVANKPVLFYGLEAMYAAGIREVGIVVGETRAEIEAAVGDGSRFGLAVTYLPQEAPLGLAHAVLISEAYLGDSPFVMYLGDNLLKEGIAPFVRDFEQSAPDALILLQKVADPQSYGIAELEDGRVVRLVEKPAEPRSDLALVGVYLFTPAVFDERQGHHAVRPRRARDHRRHPAHGRPRPARRAARGARLVEGHRQARGHARGQPPHPQHHRAARRGHDRRLRHRGPGADRRRQRARALHGARPRRHRRRLPPQRRVHRTVHVDQRRRGRGGLARSSTPSSSRTAASRAWARACATASSAATA